MSYYDHVLMFESEASAKQILSLLGFVYEDGFTSDCLPSLTVSLPTGTFTEATEEFPSTPIVYVIPAFFMNISLPQVNTDLCNIPNNLCRVVYDRKAFKDNDGTNWFAYVAPNMEQYILEHASISPTLLGSQYPFGV